MRYTRMITITFLFLLSMSPLWVHAETVDSELSALRQEFEELYLAGEPGRAAAIATKALDIAVKTFGSSHPVLLTNLSNYAGFYYEQEEYMQSEPLYRRLLAIMEQEIGLDHPLLTMPLNLLAVSIIKQGKYAEAESLIRRVLAIMEQEVGLDHPDLASPLNLLALSYQQHGEHAQAALLYKRALVIMEHALGPNHPDLAPPLNLLALSYQQQGKPTQSKPLYNRVLAIREKMFEPDHAAIAQAIVNLAKSHGEQDEYAQAEALYERALSIKERTIGMDHPDVAKILTDLATIYKDQEKYAQAEPLFERWLALMKKTFGPDDPNVSSALDELGSLYQDQGNHAEAELHFTHSLTIREKALGLEHLDVAVSLDNLGRLYLKQGEYAQAELFFKRALTIRENVLGPEHLDVSMSRAAITNLRIIQGEHVLVVPSDIKNMQRFFSEYKSTTFTSIDKTIRDAFNARCGTEQMSLFGFPDVYLNPNELAACEIAFIIDPKRFAKQYKARLLAQSLKKSISLDSDLHEASNVIFSHFKEIYQTESTNIDLALAGYPDSFYNLLIQNTSLSSEQRESMYELIGESMTELFFGRFIDPEYKPSETDLLVAAEQILNHAQYMSGVVLDIAIENIHSALAKSYENKSVAEMYLSMTLTLRKYLLALASMTNSFSQKEISIMQAIQFSTMEHDFSAFTMGDRNSFIHKRITKYPVAEFIWLSTNIAEVKKGGFLPNSSVWIFKKLIALATLHPELIQQHAKHFPDINYDEIISIDIASLGKRYEKALRDHSVTNLSEFEISLLISDIRTEATLDREDEFIGYLDLIVPDNPLVLELIKRQDNPLIELAFQTSLRKIKDEWKLVFNNVEELFEKTANNIDTVCDAISEEMCDRMWRNIMLVFVITSDANIIVGKCHKSPLIVPILKRQLSAGHMDITLAVKCTRDSLTIILNKLDSEVISLMTKTIGSGHGSGRSILNNESFTIGGGGLVAKHIYNLYQDRQISLVPKFEGNLNSLDSRTWDYFYEIANNPIPKQARNEEFFRAPDLSSSFRAPDVASYKFLANIYSIMGNHERAFLTQLSRTEKEHDNFIAGLNIILLSDSLVNLTLLKQYARNSGVPEPYVNLIIDKYKIVINQIPDTINTEYLIKYQKQQNKESLNSTTIDPDVIRIMSKKLFSKGFDTTHLKEFLNKGDLPSVFPLFDETKSGEISPRLVGKILALTRSDQEELCKNIVSKKLLTPNTNTLNMFLWKNKSYFGGGPFTNFDPLLNEYLNFDSRCRYLWIEEKKYSLNKGEYEHMFKDFLLSSFIIEEIEKDGLFTDPRYSSFMLLLSDYAEGTGDINGVVASLIILKHSFEIMADAYIYRNSAALRLKMPDIENIIVNTTKALRDTPNGNKKQTAIFSRLMRRTESLAASAHAVFLSDRTRARLLDVENRTFMEVADDVSVKGNTAAYNEMTEYFHKARNTLAASKTISEAIVNKARFGEHGVHAIPRFYKAAAQIEKAIASPKQIFPTSNNSVLLNILSNGKQIYFQLLDDKGHYLSDTLDIKASLTTRLKERITRNTRITADDIKLGCDAFSEVHRVLKPLIKDYNRIAVVPSVNLLPIPTELIIGTACDTSNPTIIHTADVLAAIELMRSGTDITLPQSFVGIGNPTLPLESNQIKIAAIDGGSREIVRNLSAIDEFSPLPDAEAEIHEIAEIFRDTNIFTAAKGSIMKGLDAAQINRQNGKDSAIVLATHGVGLDLGQGFELPSLLSVEDGRPTLIGATAVQQFDLDGSIVVLSACDTAAGLYEKPEMMFTGFVESFADARSSFIVASLLPVRSQASKQHTVAFFRALKNGSIWQAAHAGKKALLNATDSLPFVYIYP